VYTEAIELDPCHPVNLGNYALFLYIQCQQYEEAEEFFLRALEADPQNVSNLSNYAK
jgi:Tfp pilus assembly protein PilF